MVSVPMSSFDIKVAVEELQQLVGGFVQKVYQPSFTSIALRVRLPSGGNRELYAEINGPMFLSQRTVEKPPTASQLAMFMRKRIYNARIGAIRQHAFDRIVRITLQKAENYEVVLELFRNGNVMILKDGIIERAITAQEWATRTIKKGEEYIPPPEAADPLYHESMMGDALLEEGKKLVRRVASAGMGGPLAEEVIHRAGLDPEMKVLTPEQRDTLRKVMHEVLEGERDPVVYRTEAGYTRFHPIPYNNEEGEVVRLGSFLDCIETVFYGSPPGEDATAIPGGTGYAADEGPLVPERSPEEDRLIRQMEMQEASLEKFTNQSELMEKAADAIYNHWSEVEALLPMARSAVKGGVEPTGPFPSGSSFDSLDKDNGWAWFRIGEDMVPLAGLADPNAEASACFKRIGKVRDKCKGARTALEDTRKKLESGKHEARKKAARKPVLGRKYWFQKFRWFVSSDGYLCVAGKDAKSNEQLVKKYLKEPDVYAHSSVHGAPSVVVRRGVRFLDIEGKLNVKLDMKTDEDIPERTKEEAALFSGIFSKGWSTGYAAAEGYWVNGDQVSKTAQSGEFVGTGAFIIRGKRNSVTGSMELAIGVVRLKEGETVVSGPVITMKKYTDTYVVIAPGPEKKVDVQKRVARFLEVPVDAVQAHLPSGTCVIVRKVEGKKKPAPEEVVDTDADTT